MAKCFVCGESVVTGAVVHPDCIKPKWNKTSECLPEPDVMVLVVASGKVRDNITYNDAIDLGRYCAVSGWYLENWPGAEVTVSHWMAVPELPEDAMSNRDFAERALDMVMAERDALYKYQTVDKPKMEADLRAMKGELCLMCGKYREAHLGACDGCRWRGVG